jgi:four helix bundle protein
MISNLEDFKVYNMAMDLGEDVWDVVNRWKFFEKDTVGKQLVRAADSIAANLSEGLGRYHYKESKNFSYYSRGSLFETKIWLTKAVRRRLIDQEKFDSLINKLEIIGKMLNSYINSIGVSEPETPYGTDPVFPNA